MVEESANVVRMAANRSIKALAVGLCGRRNRLAVDVADDDVEDAILSGINIYTVNAHQY